MRKFFQLFLKFEIHMVIMTLFHNLTIYNPCRKETLYGLRIKKTLILWTWSLNRKYFCIYLFLKLTIISTMGISLSLLTINFCHFRRVLPSCGLKWNNYEQFGFFPDHNIAQILGMDIWFYQFNFLLASRFKKSKF